MKIEDILKEDHEFLRKLTRALIRRGYDHEGVTPLDELRFFRVIVEGREYYWGERSISETIHLISESPSGQLVGLCGRKLPEKEYYPLGQRPGYQPCLSCLKALQRRRKLSEEGPSKVAYPLIESWLKTSSIPRLSSMASPKILQEVIQKWEAGPWVRIREAFFS